MKRLKCIGGPADGKIVEVESHYLDGDILRVRRRMPSVLSGPDLSADPPNVTSKLIFDYYIVHALHFAPGTPLWPRGETGDPRRWTGHITTLEFLAPQDWTQEQAIRYQFEKVGPVKYHIDPMVKFKVTPPDIRKLRVYRLAHQIMHTIAKYFDKSDDSYQHALEDLTDAFYDVGAEIITDDDRRRAGLQPRNEEGWTQTELLELEAVRLVAMRSPKPPQQFTCLRPGCTITANLCPPACHNPECPNRSETI
jgi:hypothetical protein